MSLKKRSRNVLQVITMLKIVQLTSKHISNIIYCKKKILKNFQKKHKGKPLPTNQSIFTNFSKFELLYRKIVLIIFPKNFVECSLRSKLYFKKFKKNIIVSFLRNLNFSKKSGKTAIFGLKTEIPGPIQMAGVAESAGPGIRLTHSILHLKLKL